MAAPQSSLLAALLEPMAVAEFLHEYWPGTPLQVHGPPARLPPLLRDPVLESSATLAHSYGGRVRFTHGGSDRMAAAGETSAATLLDMGLCVQFVDLDTCVHNVRPFCRQIESELGMHEGAVSMKAFAATGDDGLPCHFDAAELLSVQLAGAKQFHYAPMTEIPSPCGTQYAPGSAPFEEMYPQAVHGFPRLDPTRVEVARMRPGSVLFLPRGYWHYTSATDDSLSVSICIESPPALRSLLDQLRCLLLQDPRWRRPLYSTPGCDGARERAAELLAALPALTARISADDLVDAPARLDWRLEHMSGVTRFQRTPHGRLRIGDAGADGKIVVRFVVNDRTFQVREVGAIEVTPATLPLLRWIESRTEGPFALAQAAQAHPLVTPAALKEVLRLCTQRQLLRLLWYPSLT